MSVRPYEEQPTSMILVCQSLLLTMHESTIITHNGRLTSDPFNIISSDSSPHEGNHSVSATMSVATPVAASTDTSAHHTMVGNCDSVSSMSSATWEPATVQVYEESKDFSIALTLDTNGVLNIGLDIIGDDCVVNSLAIEREACVISSVTDHFPFMEYEDLCNDVRRAFPGLASLVDSIDSAFATTIAEDLKKDDNYGNLLDLDSYAKCIHVPTLDECIASEVSIQLDWLHYA